MGARALTGLLKKQSPAGEAMTIQQQGGEKVAQNEDFFIANCF
jgi:hypothetical protein